MKRSVFIDEIKEECLKEGVLEKYQRERAERRYLERHPRWKEMWYEYVLPTLIIAIWVIYCAIVFLGKLYVLMPTVVCAGVGAAICVIYLFGLKVCHDNE